MYTGARLGLELRFKGQNASIGSTAGIALPGNSRERWEGFRVISRAEFCARRFGLNPKLPDPSLISDQTVQEIETAFSLATEGRITKKELLFAISDPNPQTETMLKEIREKGEARGYFKATIPFQASLFGERGEVVGLEVEAIEGRVTELVPTPEQKERGIKAVIRVVAVNGGEIPLVLPPETPKGSPDSARL